MSSASVRAWLIAGVALLNLFLFTMVGLSIQRSHYQYQEHAEITTRNLAQTLESEIVSAIMTDDLALLTVKDEYQRQLSAGAVNGKALKAYIERVRSRLPEIDALRITDANGLLVYGNDITPGAHISLADRPHFARLRNDPKAGLVITKPQVSRVNQKWVVILARRIDWPDGSFGGMVFAAIALEHLSKTFSALNVGAHGVVVLRDQELGVIARYPELQGIGSTVGSTVMAPEFKDLVAAQPFTGTALARSRLDQIERVYFYRRVGAFPLYIFVGLATEDYLAVWRDKATEQAALAALFALITLAAAWLIYRAWKHQANLELEKEKYWRFFQLSSDLMCIADPFGCFTKVNPALIRLIGYCESELISKPFLEFILLEDRQKTAEEMTLQVSVRPSLNFENRFLCKDGTVVCLAWTAYFDQSDGFTYATARDVTALKQAQAALQEARELIDEAHRLSRLGGWKYDCATRRVTWTDEVYRIYGVGKDYDPNNVESDIGFYLAEDAQAIRCAFERAISAGEPYDLELRLNRQDGARIWVRTTGIARMDKGQVSSVTGYIIDITERKQMEEQVRQLAFYDPLTKLPNRRLLNDRLRQSISASKRSGFYSALIYLDLDNFKPLNDSHGHVAGDLLLVEAASRLKSCVREMDTVARVGGDEFVVLLNYLNLDKVESTAQAQFVAEKIRIALSEPYWLTTGHEETNDVTVEHRGSASIGVVVFINHEGHQDDILQWADSAMYSAKEAGRNSIRFYDQPAKEK